MKAILTNPSTEMIKQHGNALWQPKRVLSTMSYYEKRQRISMKVKALRLRMNLVWNLFRKLGSIGAWCRRVITVHVHLGADRVRQFFQSSRLMIASSLGMLISKGTAPKFYAVFPTKICIHRIMFKQSTEAARIMMPAVYPAYARTLMRWDWKTTTSQCGTFLPMLGVFYLMSTLWAMEQKTLSHSVYLARLLTIPHVTPTF
mmetsp:Transcript_19847/g.28270  ORF Transcript_19847/g.28270 Transcript_19847/m.28270 type:complete len:202 (+) Transcript_19847:1026-1631(+)